MYGSELCKKMKLMKLNETFILNFFVRNVNSEFVVRIFESVSQEKNRWSLPRWQLFVILKVAFAMFIKS